jgi:alpha-glucosidase (family GH31 glycosyl hydrolase)
MVNGYLENNIPLGAIDIDSGWSTGYNNFIWDTKKFPNITEMVSHLHSLNISVICVIKYFFLYLILIKKVGNWNGR